MFDFGDEHGRSGSGILARPSLSLVCILRAAVFLISLLTLLPAVAAQEQPVHIQVHSDHVQQPLPPVWNYFGYDEPNFTYAPNGQKLLRQIGALSPVPAYIRVHNLFTTGDGSASLKWGSTNVYTEDAAGHPVYSWQIVDRIFDTLHNAGVTPLVELGFMPEALSTHPEPYRHNFPNGSIFTGWAYPPKDYQKWAELVYQFVRHMRERYGEAEVKTWLWEVWNEPDIPYWQGTPEEYFKLYDYAADAVRRALPEARVGGPDSTGPGRPKAAEFLRQFLQHCDSGRNYATNQTGAPLDFVSFHPKGAPTWQSDHVQMGIAAQLNNIEQGFKIVASFSKWAHTPVILGESDPEGCAACDPAKFPQYGYRNTSLYASYEAEVLARTLVLAEQNHVTLAGAVTWAFEFEGQPLFAGFRALATDGVNKPVFNAFRMFGLMGGERVEAASSAALSTEQVVSNGVRGQPDVNVIATRQPREVELLVWNYDDEDVTSPPAQIKLEVAGLPSEARRCLLEHFRVDANHSNSYTAWNAMGSPQSPTPDQYQQLESAGQLQLLTSPEWISPLHGTAHVDFELPREGLSLVRISW